MPITIFNQKLFLTGWLNNSKTIDRTNLASSVLSNTFQKGRAVKNGAKIQSGLVISMQR